MISIYLIKKMSNFGGGIHIRHKKPINIEDYWINQKRENAYKPLLIFLEVPLDSKISYCDILRGIAKNVKENPEESRVGNDRMSFYITGKLKIMFDNIYLLNKDIIPPALIKYTLSFTSLSGYMKYFFMDPTNNWLRRKNFMIFIIGSQFQPKRGQIKVYEIITPFSLKVGTLFQ